MKQLDEKDDRPLIDEWYAEAKKQTTETISAFLAKLTTEYSHDYGTICHAIAAAAIGAAWAVEHSPQGGITGFQSGAVFWEFTRAWGNFPDGPKRMVLYENMLYPQYNNKFQKTIDQDTWEWLQAKAKKHLDDVNADANAIASPGVVKHWKSIVKGVVPFGYTVEASGD